MSSSRDHAPSTCAATPDGAAAAAPKGLRETIVTYTLRDGSGMIRGRGLTSEEQAVAAAEGLLENAITPTAITIERVTYVSFTHREDGRTLSNAEGRS